MSKNHDINIKRFTFNSFFTGEHSPLRKFLLYIFARYIEIPLLKISFHLLRGKWRHIGSKKWLRQIAGVLLVRPFGYLGDSARPVPYEHILEYIDEIDGPIAVGPCRCRMGHQACDHPLETDMVMRTGYNAWMKAFPKEYRQISREEAREIITRCHKLNMFHMVFIHCPVNLYNEYVICNCCTCGCVPYIINRDLGQLNYPLIDGFYLAVTDTNMCSGCGTCVEICPFEARKMKEGRGITLDNCFGCGLCKYSCRKGAISMKKLRDPLPRDSKGNAPEEHRPSLYKQHQPFTEENGEEP